MARIGVGSQPSPEDWANPTIQWDGSQYTVESNSSNVGSGSTSTGTSTTPTTNPTPQVNPGVALQPSTPNLNTNPQITPNASTNAGQIGVVDAAGSLVLNPELLTSQGMTLTGATPPITPTQVAAGTIDPNNPAYAQQPSTVAPTATGTPAANVQQQAPTQAAPVTAATSQQATENAAMTSAQGQLSAASQLTAPQFDTEAIAAGQTGTGAALQKSAQQNMTNIIDTTTMAGKLIAQQLGEGNYTDAKATVKGQLDILQGEFVDASTGQAKIPSWAAGTARNVSRIAAFKGMTGTAAVSAMSQAIMEASLPIAQQDATFFQTLTVKNLDNRQEATINAANVLAKMDLTNMDMRMTAAVENANNFMKLDLQNLDNEQQSRVINTQARVQSILEDAKAENAARLFVADSQNEKDKFYSSLNSSIDQFNSAQKNAMEQFNAGETNDNSQFNATLENNRQQFYKDMQFQIDTANTKWRQTVTLTENAQSFEAAATDVKDRLGVSTEELNRLWDRSDALLDYLWKTADNASERQNQLALVKLQGDTTSAIEDQKGFGSILGSILGSGASSLFSWLFAL